MKRGVSAVTWCCAVAPPEEAAVLGEGAMMVDNTSVAANLDPAVVLLIRTLSLFSVRKEKSDH